MAVAQFPFRHHLFLMLAQPNFNIGIFMSALPLLDDSQIVANCPQTDSRWQATAWFIQE